MADARDFAKNYSGPERNEILELADEVERLSNQLADLKRKGKVKIGGGCCGSLLNCLQEINFECRIYPKKHITA